MQQTLEFFAAEGRIILQAPASFATALALLVTIVWIVLSWSYSSQINNLESRIKLKEEQIANYKEKLSGASPEEAKQRIDALELQIKALSPRRLREQQKAAIAQSLRGKARASISIAQDGAVADSKALSADLASAFQAAGWTVAVPMVIGVGNPPPTGIALRINNASFLTSAEQATKAALEAADIRFDIQSSNKPQMPEMPSSFDSVEILLTAKSN